jgi:prevent-host-death family protein
MQQMINLREVNQNLSKYIRLLHEGDEILITKNGKAVAKLVSITGKKKLTTAQHEALQRIRHLAIDGYHLGGESINRDDLYER